MPRPSNEVADSSDFGKRLRKCRLAAGLTLDALSERTGIAANRLSTMETATKSNPTLSTIQKLAAALGVRPADLIGE